MYVIKFPFALVSIFLWIGFVCSISFMEAWLKFRAPGVSLPIGLGIGKIVFNALNWMEWIFAAIIIMNYLYSYPLFHSFNNYLILLPICILLVQTFYLLPALENRADLYIQQKEVAASNLHFVYLGLEFIKIITLSIIGIQFFKAINP